MNVGFVNAYPYRPHGHHADYLAKLCKALGWRTHALVCDASPETCYLRELKGTGKSECMKCHLGSLRTFHFDSVESVSLYRDTQTVGSEGDDFDCLVESSAFTLTRIESWEQRSSTAVAEKKRRLLPGALMFYAATREWIRQHGLELVIVFNGRMDLTRAVTAACQENGIDYLTHERPLYGHGIILNKNDNCSSLAKIHAINKVYCDLPLTEHQSRVAAKLLAQRLIGGNPLEWKRYNTDATSISDWPFEAGRQKILICPSSKNELLGHVDWETPWRDNADALDLAVAKGWFGYEDCLVRFHPSWGENFGRVSAHLCEEHYRQWCKKRGVAYIESNSKIKTIDLIRLADVVVVNGSNTVFEAGAIGKPIICLGSSPYSHSRAAVDLLTLEDFEWLDYKKAIAVTSRDQIRQTLRYMYSKVAREPLFVDYVRSRTVTECDFYKGASPAVLETLLADRDLLVNDSESADAESAENAVIDLLEVGDMASLSLLAAYEWQAEFADKMVVSRRTPYQLIDTVRALFPKGV